MSRIRRPARKRTPPRRPVEPLPVPVRGADPAPVPPPEPRESAKSEATAEETVRRMLEAAYT